MSMNGRQRGVLAAVFAGTLVLGASVTMRTFAQAPAPPTAEQSAVAAERPAPNVPASEAIPVQQVPSPASPTHAPEQAMWALIASYAMQYLKRAQWFGFLTEKSSGRVKAQFGFVAAALTAAGVHFAITGDMLDGSGATLTITGLSLDAFKDVAFQWASQQAWFDLVVHRRDPATPA